jgi:hypothetical protein
MQEIDKQFYLVFDWVDGKSLKPNEIRYDPIWQEKMFEIEMKVSDINDYINISFYNHGLLKKIG